MTATTCLDCGVVTRRGSRCILCERSYQRRRRANPTMRYGSGYGARHRAAVQAEPWCHNPRCPYPDAGTPTNPLTADHPLPVSRGGSPLQALVVVCRSCNWSKSNRYARGGGGGVTTGSQPVAVNLALDAPRSVRIP